jgi:hypothetical protein
MAKKANWRGIRKSREHKKEVVSTRIRADIMDALRVLKARADSELATMLNVALEEFLDREMPGWRKLPPPAPAAVFE